MHTSGIRNCQVSFSVYISTLVQISLETTFLWFKQMFSVKKCICCSHKSCHASYARQMFDLVRLQITNLRKAFSRIWTELSEIHSQSDPNMQMKKKVRERFFCWQRSEARPEENELLHSLFRCRALNFCLRKIASSKCEREEINWLMS